MIHAEDDMAFLVQGIFIVSGFLVMFGMEIDNVNVPYGLPFSP